MSCANLLQGLQFGDLPSEDRLSIVEVIEDYFTNSNTSDSDESSDEELFNTSG